MAEMSTFDKLAEVIGKEEGVAGQADKAFAEVKAAFQAVEARYMALRGAKSDGGDTMDRIATLVRKYGPVAAKYFGGPAAGAAATTIMADGGSFSGLRELFGKLLSVVGVG